MVWMKASIEEADTIKQEEIGALNERIALLVRQVESAAGVEVGVQTDTAGIDTKTETSASQTDLSRGYELGVTWQPPDDVINEIETEQVESEEEYEVRKQISLI